MKDLRTPSVPGWETRQEEVLSHITHDLRAPLCAIMGYLDLVGRQVGKAAPPKAVEYLSLAREAGERMHHMVNDILDMFRLENGANCLRREGVEVTQLFHDVLKTFVGLAELKEINLEFQIRGRTPPRVWADRRLLERVFDNLVANAIKFTPAGGRIRVLATRLPERVVFDVTDSGRGIPREDRERVFEKFQHVLPSDQQRGHGMGLAVVKAIVEAHGGTVRVASRFGKGTRFTFWIPAVPTPIVNQGPRFK